MDKMSSLFQFPLNVTFLFTFSTYLSLLLVYESVWHLSAGNNVGRHRKNCFFSWEMSKTGDIWDSLQEWLTETLPVCEWETRQCVHVRTCACACVGMTDTVNWKGQLVQVFGSDRHRNVTFPESTLHQEIWSKSDAGWSKARQVVMLFKNNIWYA